MGLKGEQGEGQVRGKMAGPNPGLPLKLGVRSARKVGGRRGVAEKCIVITTNSEGEGGIPAPN